MPAPEYGSKEVKEARKCEEGPLYSDKWRFPFKWQNVNDTRLYFPFSLTLVTHYTITLTMT